MNGPDACREAERRLAELLGVLEARELDVRALESAGARVAAAMTRLTRHAAPDSLARVLTMHACVREAAALRRDEAGESLARTQSDRERLSHLTRPSDAAGSLDVRA